jgi:hypothetical protein
VDAGLVVAVTGEPPGKVAGLKDARPETGAVGTAIRR